MNTAILSYRAIRTLLLVAVLSLALGVVLYASAQTASPSSQDVASREAELQHELDDINQEITGLNNTISGLKGQGASLDRDIKLLDATISRANLNIKAKNLEIARLADGITQKSRTVKTLATRLENERQSLMQLIRKTNELDQATLAETVLSGESISDFFLDLDSFDSLRAALKNSSDSLRSAKNDTVAAQNALEDKQAEEMDAKAELERNKQIVLTNQAEKKRLLNITKNKESEYNKVLADRKKKAAEIRAALFALRDTGEIQFGQALDYANTVSAKTGIRPAFLLAIFMQESGFGKNQGSCYLRNTSTGSGVGSRTGTVFPKVMNPTRDVPPFLEITSQLGRDPLNTLVSCPQEVGWGGAMGAAQFIPSTWQLFSSRITKALGTSIADPWSARDAFMAAGIYLADLGADSQSYSAEMNAACRYFSGSKCANSSWASTYGKQVMTKASTIQTTMIDPLNS